MSEELEVLKMFDTHPEIAVRYRELMMSKTGQQRLLMGCSMYDTAKKIVRSAIYNSRPGITDAEIKKEIFLRFYGQDFSRAEREKFLSALCRVGFSPPNETNTAFHKLHDHSVISTE